MSELAHFAFTLWVLLAMSWFVFLTYVAVRREWRVVLAPAVLALSGLIALWLEFTALKP